MKKQLFTAILSLCSIFAFSQTITGPDTICPGIHTTYSISSTGATSYIWSIPSGTTINSVQGTISINYDDYSIIDINSSNSIITMRP